MSLFSLLFLLAAIGLVYLTKRYRRNAWVIAIEFVLTSFTTVLLLNLELYKYTGGEWVFGIRALILFWAMRQTLKLKPGHIMIYCVMLLGAIYNIGTYWEYALKDYGFFDTYYTPAAMAVMVLQLLYMLGIGYVGTYSGRIYISIRRGWLTYRLFGKRDLSIGRLLWKANK